MNNSMLAVGTVIKFALNNGWIGYGIIREVFPGCARGTKYRIKSDVSQWPFDIDEERVIEAVDAA